jgi:hypothetical protein
MAEPNPQDAVYLFGNRPLLLEFSDQLLGTMVRRGSRELLLSVDVDRLCEALSDQRDSLLALRCQRAVDPERVTQLYNRQMDEHAQYGDFGILNAPVVLGHCAELQHPMTNHYGITIIDGQHRIEVLKEIRAKNPHMLYGYRTVIRVFLATSVGDLEDYFREINRNWVPVPLYNLTPVIQGAVDRIIGWMIEKYGGCYFTESRVAKRPQILLGQLREKLGENVLLHKVLDTYRLNPSAAIEYICHKFDEYNLYLYRADLQKFYVAGISEDRAVVDNLITLCVTCPNHREALLFPAVWDYVWITRALEHQSVNAPVGTPSALMNTMAPMAPMAPMVPMTPTVLTPMALPASRVPSRIPVPPQRPAHGKFPFIQ